MTQTITVVIHTHNEEKNIQDAITSAKLLSNEIVVIDMNSTDRTVETAKINGATVYNFEYMHYVEPARDFAMEKVISSWAFLLDCDERITSELAQEIKGAIENTTNTYYKIPRKNLFLEKKWLQHGGWYPDFVIRLIKKTAFLKWPKQIHSSPTIQGECGFLKQPLIHLFHPNLENMVTKTIVYEDIESQLLFDAKKTTYIATFFRKYLGELWRRLILKAGYKDGSFGIIESFYQAYSKTITYLFLYEKHTKKSPTL